MAIACGKLGLVGMSKTQIETFRPPSADDPVLPEVVRRLVEAYHPLRIYLFGSAARGDAGPDSDYDSDLSAINRPKAAVPLARRRLSGEGGILFQLRLPLGGEGSARVSIWQGPPGHSPQGHDSIYLTFGRTEQPRSRLGRTRWRCDPSPLPCLSARFDHRAWPPAQTVA